MNVKFEFVGYEMDPRRLTYLDVATLACTASILLVSDVVVVVIDLAAQLSRLHHPWPANLIVLVVWNVQLEEASVWLWEASIGEVVHKAHLVFPAEVAHIDGQPGPTPHKLQILGLLELAERFECAPEAADDGVVVGALGICRDRSKLLNVEDFLAAGSRLDSFPGQVGHGLKVAAHHDLHTLHQRFHLFCRFSWTSLEDQVNELVQILLSDQLCLAIWAQRYLVTTRKNCRKVLIDSRCEVLIRQEATVLSQIV